MRNVFGGKLKAKGVYNLDTRAYELTGVATDLDSSMALKTPDFAVPVSANLNFSSKGQPKDMVVWGDFTSGAGRYILIPIQSITGRFLQSRTTFILRRCKGTYVDIYNFYECITY